MDTDSVSKYLSSTGAFNKVIRNRDIHKVLFFHYSPWVIKEETLNNIKGKDYVFSLFKIVELESRGNLSVVLVDWAIDKKNKPNSVKLFLYKDKNELWKIKKVDIIN